MLVSLFQVLFAAIRTVGRSAINIMLYSILSRVFKQWLGFNTIVAFFCSAYCLSKIVGFFKRTWLNARLKNKKPDERIVPNELIWHSPTTIAMSIENPTESAEKFEDDWQYLLNDEKKNLFPAIVDIPCNNAWLFFAVIFIVDYQMNSLGYSYIISLVRTIGCLIVLVCGSSVRYETLYQRGKNNFFDFMIKNRDEIERYVVYSPSANASVASVCLQIIKATERSMIIVQINQLNSKFDDYAYDITNFICQKLIERVKTFANESEKPVSLVWSVPSCKQSSTFAIKANKLLMRYSYKDFSFMPLVNSYVEQYEYLCEYEPSSSSETAEHVIKNE